MSGSILYEDIFEVKNIDPDGKKFDRVSRLHCEGESFKMDVTLDVNTWVYPVALGDKFRIVLATSVREDDAPETHADWDPGQQLSVAAENYDYIMYGQIYRVEGDEDIDQASTKLNVYLSFGGLLMLITGEAATLNGFHVEQKMFLLMKKLPY